MEFDKNFLIIGNLNARTYKEIFRIIRNNQIWFGYTNPKKFIDANDLINGINNLKIFGNICWFTNLEIKKRNEILETVAEFNSQNYLKYDNYNAINCDKVSEIPLDYDGILGVPMTFLDRYNPKQFEILGLSASAGYDKEIVGIDFMGEKDARPIVNGKVKFARIFIKNKKPKKG